MQALIGTAGNYIAEILSGNNSTKNEILTDYNISINNRDNYVILDNKKMLKVIGKENGIFVGHLSSLPVNLYAYPVDSVSIGAYSFPTFDQINCTFHVSNIKRSF